MVMPILLLYGMSMVNYAVNGAIRWEAYFMW